MTEPTTGIVLDVVIPGLPPSSNNAYFNLPRGGRTLTAAGKAYKTSIKTMLMRECAPQLRNFQRNVPYGLCITLTLTDMFNSTWPEKAATRYKKLDASNRVKLLEDALVEAIGIDDSQFLSVISNKQSGETDFTRITVWHHQLWQPTPVGNAKQL